MGLLPLIHVGGSINLTTTNMVSQLQAINQIVTNVGNKNDCQYLGDSVYAWGTGVTAGNKADDAHDAHTPYLLYLWLGPTGRCPLDSEEGELFTSILCDYFKELDPGNLTQTDTNQVTVLCTVWGDSRRNITDDELATRAEIRTGAIQVVSASNVANLTLADGVTVVNATYLVEAKFNQTITVQTA